MCWVRFTALYRTFGIFRTVDVLPGTPNLSPTPGMLVLDRVAETFSRKIEAPIPDPEVSSETSVAPSSCLTDI